MQNQLAVGVGGGLLFGVLLSVAISGTLTDGKIERAVGQAGETATAAMSEATGALEARIAELEASLADSASATAAQMDEKLAALEADVSSRMTALAEEAEARVADLAALADGVTSAPESDAAPTEGGTVSDMATSDALGVGETAIFADGAVRVFVSAVDQDSRSARLSVNGAAQTLSVGETAGVTLEGADCTVGLVEVTEAGATIGSDCGSETAEAAPADVPPAPEEGHTPGTTVSLADGALRVFVSSLAADGSAARLAVNGIDTVTVASGTSIEVAVGDQTCTVTVTGVGNGMVGLDGSCS
ncbi:ABC transporter C-terminal domain-containing protein [uncultured Roseobacter sp.]|uniref:ABC transporter C-terminal domain-containing protein n=1 Tax=uncultured Roseobacter sp. TaxID=114847 RepID=UPI0026352DAF|nr:ABC transporter C-terminal domain-containing protein [uncultured Roseobacter sp.]